MPELVIRYKGRKTLDAIRGIAAYFGFSLVEKRTEAERRNKIINGVTIIPADKRIDPTGLESIFSEKGMDARQLRLKAWQRNR